MVAEIVFWSCVGALAFTYVGYPLVLGLIALCKPRPEPPQVEDWPHVSVLIVARNEEDRIRDKIANVLASDYPADRLEVTVCSDGSTDGTNQLVADYGDGRVRLVASETNVGVNEALALGAARAAGEVLAMTDVAGRYLPGSILAAVRHFADPKVGLVGGRMANEDPRRSAVGAGNRAYWLVETGVRLLESRLGLGVVILGACEFIRREAYLPIPSVYSNDMGAPMYARSLGYLCRYEPQAVLVHEHKAAPRQEFARRLRMVVRAWPNLAYLRTVVPFWRNLGSWLALLCHKYLRWLTWLFMLGALAGGAPLWNAGAVYRVALAVQAAFYGVALLGWLLAALRVKAPLLGMPFYFCLLQAAAMIGFFQALAGRRIRTWTPTD